MNYRGGTGCHIVGQPEHTGLVVRPHGTLTGRHRAAKGDLAVATHAHGRHQRLQQRMHYEALLDLHRLVR